MKITAENVLEFTHTMVQQGTPAGTTPEEYQLMLLETLIKNMEAEADRGGPRSRLDLVVPDWEDVDYVYLAPETVDGVESYVGEVCLKLRRGERIGRVMEVRPGMFAGVSAAAEAVAFFEGRGLELTRDRRKEEHRDLMFS